MLVEVSQVCPNILIDLRYATINNFTGQVLYSFKNCYVHKNVAIHLVQVQSFLESVGYGLKIWDGFRPIESQWDLWKIVPDEKFVSDPRKGGRHTRGTAIDVTLVNSSGEELIMPSEFDDFSEKANRNYVNDNPQSIKNRDFLQKIMEENGFIGLQEEWWHFDLIGWESYPVLDSTAFVM